MLFDITVDLNFWVFYQLHKEAVFEIKFFIHSLHQIHSINNLNTIL